MATVLIFGRMRIFPNDWEGLDVMEDESYMGRTVRRPRGDYSAYVRDERDPLGPYSSNLAALAAIEEYFK